MTEREFDPLRALATLNRHGVRYVLIGGFAGKLHGSSALTVDVDICYVRDDDNFGRLVAALQELHATLRGTEPDLPFRLDVRTLRNGDAFTFVTDAGDLDIIGSPAGTSGYEDLARTAVRMDLEPVEVDVASIDDLIAMKRASHRPRDRAHLEILGALRDELDQRIAPVAGSEVREEAGPLVIPSTGTPLSSADVRELIDADRHQI